eukprot:6204005-Pleurochrysis_carterae.AAC.5
MIKAQGPSKCVEETITPPLGSRRAGIMPSTSKCIPPLFTRRRLQLLGTVSALDELAQDAALLKSAEVSNKARNAAGEVCDSPGNILSTLLRRSTKLFFDADAGDAESDTLLQEPKRSEPRRRHFVSLPMPQAWHEPGDCVLCGDPTSSSSSPETSQTHPVCSDCDWLVGVCQRRHSLD